MMRTLSQRECWDMAAIVLAAQLLTLAVMVTSAAASGYAWYHSATGSARAVTITLGVVCAFWAGFGFRLAGRAWSRGAPAACIVTVLLTAPAMMFDAVSNHRAMNLQTWSLTADQRQAQTDIGWFVAEVDRLEAALDDIEYPGDSEELRSARDALPATYVTKRMQIQREIAQAERFEELETELDAARKSLRSAETIVADFSPDQVVDGHLLTGLVIFVALFSAATNWTLAAGRSRLVETDTPQVLEVLPEREAPAPAPPARPSIGTTKKLALPLRPPKGR